MTKGQHTTSYIKHLAVSGLSSFSSRIKSSCNLTGKCLEMPKNVSYTSPLCATIKNSQQHDSWATFKKRTKKMTV